jgi:putative DNA primase/helicase
LFITAPVKDCGKTTLLLLVGAMSARPINTVRLTEAAFVRVMARAWPTLLIDEADTFLRTNEFLRGAVDAGHYRPSASTIRLREKGGDWEPQLFDCWGAVAMAGIGYLPGTIESRSIKIKMQRRRIDDPLEPLRLDRLHVVTQPLARKVARFVTDSFDFLVKSDPQVPKQLLNRDADNWRPLLTIAEAAGGNWLIRGSEAALEISGFGKRNIRDLELKVLLLSDLREMFIYFKRTKFKSEVIVRALAKMENRPWARFDRGKAISAPSLAAQLKEFGIEPKVIRFDNGPKPLARGYEMALFEEAWECHLPPRNGPAPGAIFSPYDIEEPGIPELLRGVG